VRVLPAAALTSALALLGCGNSEEAETPEACLQGRAAIERALAASPAPVRLAGDVPISECLIEDQAAGELAQVGEALVGAATALRASAERDSAAAAERLGYLVGAVTRGAAESGGIHADLARRVTSAAEVGSAGRTAGAAFDRAYARGYAAGKEQG
jgi:hypothetical protein